MIVTRCVHSKSPGVQCSTELQISVLSENTHQTRANSLPVVHTMTTFLYRKRDRARGLEDSSETMLWISPGKEPESPEYTHRCSQDLGKSSLGNELPEGPRFLMSNIQVHKERDCTCSCVPASPADSQTGRCGLPHAVPGSRSWCLDHY